MRLAYAMLIGMLLAIACEDPLAPAGADQHEPELVRTVATGELPSSVRVSTPEAISDIGQVSSFACYVEEARYLASHAPCSLVVGDAQDTYDLFFYFRGAHGGDGTRYRIVISHY